MKITFQSEGVKLPQLKKEKLSEWIETVATSYNKKVGEISYLFCDDNKILEVNKQFLNHDFYTDIITFDYSTRNTISGDIIISIETVNSNSKLYKTSFMEELHRVIIHGILHLSGLNDLNEKDEKLMRIAENKALKLLPYNV